MQIVHEGEAQLSLVVDTPSKKLPVFYNPRMQLNRDITLLLLQTISDKELQFALPLAGSGIRAIRMLKELDNNKIKHIYLNDLHTVDAIKKQLKLNKIPLDKITLSAHEASTFLLENKGFDYIDIDPFGSPNPFLDSALKRLARCGILAVTATDTSALAGSHQDACKRKYDAIPMKNYMMHEVGLRILIRKVQLMGAQYAKALTPMFSYWDEHYYRIFFRCKKSKQLVDTLLKKHQWFHYDKNTCKRKVSDNNHEKKYVSAGPLWTGSLWDYDLVKRMVDQLGNSTNKKLIELLAIILGEAQLWKEKNEHELVGFVNLQDYANVLQQPVPKALDVISKGIARTHFLGWGVRTVDQKLVQNSFS